MIMKASVVCIMKASGFWPRHSSVNMYIQIKTKTEQNTRINE